ncbi:MAG: flagellar hook-basal body protein FliE [Alphaproteobacteria bacterium]|nr:flagellar hook-basal body protein FliE [Alphaproteobacteria bacterium]
MPAPTSITGAINAYNTVARGGAAQPKAGGADAGGEFAALVKSALAEAAQIGKAAETASLAAVNDRADIGKVVTAVAEAELTLQTVVSIRDKVIDAYREILRMPI